MAAIPPYPRVSVLLAVHNGALHLGESIASVMAQTWADFELVVVDDASTDTTPAILAGPRRSTAARAADGAKPRRGRGAQPGPRPLPGRVLAILDHDDLCHPTRLAAQVAFLQRHADVVLVGSEVRILRGGRPHAPDHPPGGSPLLMRWRLHLDNPLTFSSVMMRMDAVRRLGTFLRPGLAEDYDLYHRLLRIGEIARLDEVLTTWRAHATNLSAAAPEAMLSGAVAVLAPAIAPWVGKGTAPGAAALVIRHLSERRPVTTAAELQRLGTVLEQLAAGFCTQRAATAEDRALIWAEAGRSWWQAARAGARSGEAGTAAPLVGPPLAASRLPAVPRRLAATLGLGSTRGLVGRRPRGDGEAGPGG
jgi:hypothetical protein